MNDTKMQELSDDELENVNGGVFSASQAVLSAINVAYAFFSGEAKPYLDAVIEDIKSGNIIKLFQDIKEFSDGGRFEKEWKKNLPSLLPTKIINVNKNNI